MTCDFWECEHFDECKQRSFYGYRQFPPCACCVRFDGCEVCEKYSECCELVRRYLPDMFRRMVLEIRRGENLEGVQKYIRRNTLKGKKKE